MARKVIQKNTRDGKQINPSTPVARVNFIPTPKPIIPITIQNSKKIVQNAKRDLPKLPVFSSNNLLNQIQSFTQYKDKHYYLGFGGLGDALLLMAVCWNDPKAKVVFFANQIPFIRIFFELFGINVYLHENIMGTRLAAHIFDHMRVMSNFKQSAHLADGLDFNDWVNEKKYMARIKGNVPWIKYLGKKEITKPIVIIAPSGSHKDVNRQRYLHVHEYQQLVNFNLNKGYQVYVTGSTNDLHHFGLIDKENFFWLSSDKIYDGKGSMKTSDLKNMLRIINSAEHVISMDTWLKTYTLLCGISTTVIQTRWDGVYRQYGEDITDWIFLNLNMWPHIKLTKIEDLLL